MFSKNPFFFLWEKKEIVKVWGWRRAEILLEAEGATTLRCVGVDVSFCSPLTLPPSRVALREFLILLYISESRVSFDLKLAFGIIFYCDFSGRIWNCIILELVMECGHQILFHFFKCYNSEKYWIWNHFVGIWAIMNLSQWLWNFLLPILFHI